MTEKRMEELSAMNDEAEQPSTVVSVETENDAPIAEKDGEQKLLKLRKKLPLLLFLPYFIGTVWHAMHPMVSVFTGKTPARRYYIDENSLDPAHFRMDAKYHVIPDKIDTNQSVRQQSLCEAIRHANYKKIGCYQQISPSSDFQNFDVARIVPKSVAVAPVNEAIVLVIPWTINTSNVEAHMLQFRFSTMQLLRRLSESPWLAKTILVVSPSSDDLPSPLGATLDSFLESYLGNPSKASRLPSDFEGAMIRNILVLDCLVQPALAATQNRELRILTQGRRGALPNMDLTFSSMYIYNRANFHQSNIVMHPYRSQVQEWETWLTKANDSSFKLPTQMHHWSRELLELLAFEYTLAVGPFSPHASALEWGIDALTIQGIFKETKSSKEENERIAELLQKLEYIVRALSNLHERLHHSTSLYLLPSFNRFVKHEEYLVPNLLLVIPLVIRAVFLLLVDIQQLSLSAIGLSLAFTVIGTTLFANFIDIGGDVWLVSSLGGSWSVLFVYSILIIALHRGLFGSVKSTIQEFEKSDIQQSIQFVTCLVALCILVTIAFGHVSLAFPTALLWTPLLSFPSLLKNDNGDKIRTSILQQIRHWTVVLVKVVFFVATFPSTFLVPYVFSEYTTYLCFAYIPIHLLFTLIMFNG